MAVFFVLDSVTQDCITDTGKELLTHPKPRPVFTTAAWLETRVDVKLSAHRVACA